MAFSTTTRTRQRIEDVNKYEGLHHFEYDYKKSPEQNLFELSKVADQKLRRLEGYRRDKGYEEIVNFAYARAMSDIASWGGGKRFSKGNKNLDTNQMYAKINDVLTFLNSVTSTKKGVKMVFEKRAETLSSRYGAKIKWQDLAQMYDRGLLDWGDNYGSKSVFQAIGNFQKNFKKFKKKYAEFVGKDFKKSDVVGIAELLKSGNINITDLL